MAKNKTAKTEAAAKDKEAVAQTTTGTVKAEEGVEAVKAEGVVEAVKAEGVVEAVKAETPVVEKVAEAVKAEAAKVEAVVTEKAGQMSSFMKGRLELAQRQLGQLETDAQKVLRTLVSRGRESGREVLQKLNVNEQRWRENPTVQKLEKQATWVGGEVRQRLGVLQGRMVKAVSGVASQSQVDAINRELGRLTRKLDALVSPKKPEAQPRQEAPKA